MSRKAPHLSTRSSKLIGTIATATAPLLCVVPVLRIHSLDRNRDHMPIPKGSVYGRWLFTGGAYLRIIQLVLVWCFARETAAKECKIRRGGV